MPCVISALSCRLPLCWVHWPVRSFPVTCMHSLQRTRPEEKASVLQRILRHVRSSLTETVCIGVCASAAAFPVLVLRGLSVSIYAVLSGVAVLWMVKP